MVETISDRRAALAEREASIARGERLESAFEQRGFRSNPERFRSSERREGLESSRERLDVEDKRLDSLAASIVSRRMGGVRGGLDAVQRRARSSGSPLAVRRALLSSEAREAELRERIASVRESGAQKRQAFDARREAALRDPDIPNPSARISVQIGRQTKRQVEQLSRRLALERRVQRSLGSGKKDLGVISRVGKDEFRRRQDVKRKFDARNPIASTDAFLRRERADFIREREASPEERVVGVTDVNRLAARSDNAGELVRDLQRRGRRGEVFSSQRLTSQRRRPEGVPASFEPVSQLNNGVPASFERPEVLERRSRRVLAQRGGIPSASERLALARQAFREGELVRGQLNTNLIVPTSTFEVGKRLVNFGVGFATDNRVRVAAAEGIGRFIRQPVGTTMAFFAGGTRSFDRDPADFVGRASGDVALGLGAGRVLDPIATAGLRASRSTVGAARRGARATGRRVASVGSSLRNFARDRFVIEQRGGRTNAALGLDSGDVPKGFRLSDSDRFRFRLSVPEVEPSRSLPSFVVSNRVLNPTRIIRSQESPSRPVSVSREGDVVRASLRTPKKPVSVESDINPFQKVTRVSFFGRPLLRIVKNLRRPTPFFEKTINTPRLPSLDFVPRPSDFSVVRSLDSDSGFRSFDFSFRGKPFLRVDSRLPRRSPREFRFSVPDNPFSFQRFSGDGFRGVRFGFGRSGLSFVNRSGLVRRSPREFRFSVPDFPRLRFSSVGVSRPRSVKIPVRELGFRSDSVFLGRLLRPFARRRGGVAQKLDVPKPLRVNEAKRRVVSRDDGVGDSKVVDSVGGTQLLQKASPKRPSVVSRGASRQRSGFAPLAVFSRSSVSSRQSPLSLNQFSSVGGASRRDSSLALRDVSALGSLSGQGRSSALDSLSGLRSGQSVSSVQRSKQSLSQGVLSGLLSRSSLTGVTQKTLVPPRADLDPSNDRVEQGFFTEVRRKGRFVRVGVGARSRADALRQGAQVASGSSVMSFRAVPSGSTVRTDSPKLRKGFVDRFRKKPNGVFVEKRKDAINSAGELRDITRKGRASRGGFF